MSVRKYHERRNPLSLIVCIDHAKLYTCISTGVIAPVSYT